jgi:predicted amidohydrolase
VNRASFFGPEGPLGVQDKQVMTRFEREQWDVVPGGPLKVFDTRLGRIGVLICYDAEFPLLGRALMEAGVEILLVPSCTEALSGYSACGSVPWPARWRGNASSSIPPRWAPPRGRPRWT